ncbi:MAG: hypothetical protein K8S56_00815 [Candidatus Cloacimonetes bacterium]|nr:hypothetical protein [Candidatus Cloacimonadota bacterium]
MTDTHYHFISSARQGLAAAIDNKVTGSQKRAQIDLLLKVARRSKDSGDWDNDSIERSVQLYGPGDVVGFDERMIVRTDPKPNTGNFEPNYFPAIEFADFDFVWRFSTNPAEDKGLTPWIVLIVLIAEDRGDDIHREYEETKRGSKQLPVIKVFNQNNLPDLKNAWRWAHIQATSGQDTPSIDEDELINIINSHPECVVSRLMCTRRLQPKTLYTAFVVPAFKLGWAAGIDTKAAQYSVSDCNSADYAWDTETSEGSNTSIDLPYYYRWNFRTSVRGDFEYLVRLLEKRKLEGLGLSDIDCKHPGFGLRVERELVEGEEDEKKHFLEMEGALQSLSTVYTSWGKDKPGQPVPEEFQDSLAEKVLNKADTDRIQIALPDDFGNIIKDLEFNILDDGKSIRVKWKTDSESTGKIEYGHVISENQESFIHSSISDTKGIAHNVIIKLTPETIYCFRFSITFSDTGVTIETESAKINIPLPAVVPPIYGKWHAAQKRVKSDINSKSWLDVLNLDPRHRTAAGFGSEVVRKQQEALMASAWDQIGEIEAANDILRRAQLGRESSTFLHYRFGSMAMEDFLRTTTPAQKRVLYDQDDGSKITVYSKLDKETRIPAAALDPAFRRIMRPRGPIRKRQKQRRMDMLRRIASGDIQPAGPHPSTEGTTTLCDITKEMIKVIIPSVSLSITNATAEVSGDKGTLKLTLKWNSTNTIKELIALGDWSGTKPLNRTEEITKTWTIKSKPALVTSEDPSTPNVSEEESSSSSPICPFVVGISSSFVCPLIVDRFSNPICPYIVSKTLSFVCPLMVDKFPNPICPYIVSKTLNFVCPLMVSRFSSPQCPFIDGNSSDANDSNDEVPIPTALNWTFLLSAQTPAYKAKASIRVHISDSTIPTDPVVTVMPMEIVTKPIDPQALRFCDNQITCDQMRDAIDADAEGVNIDKSLIDAICDVFTNLLSPSKIVVKKPQQNENYFAPFRTYIYNAIDPRSTIKERVKRRLRFTGELAERFEDGATGDPLDEIMAYPEFPQPMYESLRDLSQSYILPGVEKVPQNTIGLLETNSRFMESYMVGLNHEFASELLWRRFPTDQRGSYFRQFWDVSEYVANDDPDLEEPELSEGELTETTIESLKDIRPLHEWRKTHLGKNDNHQDFRNGNNLVLVVRGDLLKRYPNAVIYSVDARLEYKNNELTGDFVPDLAEYADLTIPSSNSVSDIVSTTETIHIPNAATTNPIYPIFRGSLGADLVFLGFPFSNKEAKSSSSSAGKFFVFEERITEARFGLDIADKSIPPSEIPDDFDWDNLNWGHFQLAEIDKAGEYVDSADTIITVSTEAGEESWDSETSAALRARITLQKPVRIAVHANQLIPDK